MIDKNACTGCGICVFHCGINALALDPDTEKARLVHPCVDCFICEALCPTDAIKIVMHRPRTPVATRAGDRP